MGQPVCAHNPHAPSPTTSPICTHPVSRRPYTRHLARKLAEGPRDTYLSPPPSLCHRLMPRSSFRSQPGFLRTVKEKTPPLQCQKANEIFVLFAEMQLLQTNHNIGLRRRFKAPISSEARVRIPSSATVHVFVPCFEVSQVCRVSD